MATNINNQRNLKKLFINNKMYFISQINLFFKILFILIKIWTKSKTKIIELNERIKQLEETSKLLEEKNKTL